MKPREPDYNQVPKEKLVEAFIKTARDKVDEARLYAKGCVDDLRGEGARIIKKHWGLTNED